MDGRGDAVGIRPLISLWNRWTTPPFEGGTTCGLYEAFRLRRTKHSWRRFRGGKAFLSAGTIGLALAVWFFLVIVTGRGMKGPLIMAPFWLIGIFSVFWRYGRRREEPGMPTTLHRLMLEPARFRQAALDIWMTGAGGREIARAIYLESWHSEAKATIPVAIILYAAALTPYFLIRDWHAMPASVFTISTTVFFLCLFRFMRAGLGYQGLQAIRRRWRDDLDSIPERVAKGIGWTVLVIVIAIPSLAVFGAICGAIANAYRHSPDFIRSIRGEYFVAAPLLLASALLACLFRWSDRWNESRIRNRMIEIRDLYYSHTRAKVIRDE